MIVSWAPQQVILAHAVSRLSIRAALCLTADARRLRAGSSRTAASTASRSPSTPAFRCKHVPSPHDAPLTHGAHRICWPFGAEQPLNAIHTTETLDIAYELLEVRNGEGLKPIYRTGKAPMGTVDAVRAEAKAVFDKAFGEDGRRKRENVLKLKEASRQLWEEGGASRQDAERFLNSL